MKTRINSQLKNNKGFTLTQTLIVVAIIVILFGVIFIGVQGLVDRINQTKLDNIAQSIYVSAQNRIRELRASGEIDRLFTATELGNVTVKPADWEIDPADTVQYSNLRYFYHDKDNPTTSTSSELVDFIFPLGSIDEGVLDNNWVIELDPFTGYVYSAFYSEKRSANNFYIENTSSLDRSETDSIRFKDFRHSLKGNEKVGYYGGKANLPADVSGNMINASLNVINADVLKAKMTAIIPSIWDTSVLEFKLEVKGKTSGETVTVTLTPPGSPMPGGLTKEYSASVVLDKFDKPGEPPGRQQFKETFGDATWRPSGVERSTGVLTPGEDLELTFTVSSNDDNAPDVGPIKRTVNSLFESLNQISETEVEANIAYGRHLQNLDNATSGLPATAVTTAKQISDIDFNDDSDKDLEEQFLWNSLYGEKTFTPINNLNLTKYSGYNAVSEADSFKIFNMHIGNSIDEPGGLFKKFPGNEISDVTMVNEKIDGGTDVGGLVGTATSNLTIRNCRLYVDKAYFPPESTYVNNILFKGTSSVGGLVGTAADITIQNSFAATIIEGNDLIGGLIGSNTSGIAQIQDSYADSYLIGGAAAAKIGGLAGQLTSGSSISGSYSAGFGIIKSGVTGDKIAAAAGFVPNHISSITNSYSIFNSFESNATNIYSTAAPSVPSATTVNNVYYFESGDTNLDGSSEYTFTTIAEALAGFTGGNFSNDDNKYDTYPYNQKTDLEPQPLVTYPYVSITGLPHYGDWKIPPIPEIPEEPIFGKAGLFYWERVTYGSSSEYQIYMVGRKGEIGNYEAVFHDTTSTAHDAEGIVKEYGYGYYVAKKDNSNETYTLAKSWSNVNVPINRNTSAESSFNNNSNYSDYVFTCYNTCNEANPATSYNANTSNYMFMTANVQNATVTLTPEDESALTYTFCPFFAKSIKLVGWDSLAYTGAKPLLQYEPGTEHNPYRIRSLDQLQFINWNSDNNTWNCNQPVTKATCMNFPYLHVTKKKNSINYSGDFGWTYNGRVETADLIALAELEQSDDFEQLRGKQNFIQDFDIQCKGRTGYCPIAALGNTTGPQIVSFRLPLFAWFGGSFDGQSYKIKNLSITSNCFSVGVFGTTVGAKIKNVVLIRDSKDTAPVIMRPADSPEGHYAIGALVGIANDYSKGIHELIYPNLSTGVYEGYIKNCAVAGYEIIDNSTKPVTCGETAIGGLAGVLRTNIDRCSAVTEIKINTANDRGTRPKIIDSRYDDCISVGGIAGRTQTQINNCYSGGRVVVHSSLTKPKIYISGIAASAVNARFVNTASSDARMFRKPEYNNCYSYMKLPTPTNNIFVGTIAANANYMFNILPSIYRIGGKISNCYFYKEYYEIGQQLLPEEIYLGTNTWSGQSKEKTYDAMSQEQFCNELNSTAFHQVTPYNYSFPCGEISLEGSDYPFAAVITQKYKNHPSDPDGIKYVHYGEWPKKRGLELTKSDMELDLISYHKDANNNIIDDYSDETEVKYYDSVGIQQNISLSNLEIRKDSTWVKFVDIDDQTVIIDDKIKVSASETGGVCKLIVTGIDKTEGTEIISLRYSVNGKYSSTALNVNVTAVIDLSANPITTTVKTGEKAIWNLILKDKNGNLMDSDDISDEMEPSGNWKVTPNPSDVFSPSILKAVTSTFPFYLEATALKVGEADFEVQALKIKVRDEMNTTDSGDIRTFDSNKLDLHALCYSGKLILNHYNETGVYVENSYFYKNGASGIDPNLISEDTNLSFSALNDKMGDKIPAIIPVPTFGGWYVKDEISGNHILLIDTDGRIVSDVEGITLDGKFNVIPEVDIELFAMWRLSSNLTFVQNSGPLSSSDTRYLVIAKYTSGNITEYYCMTGESPGPGLNNPVTAKKVDLQLHGDYYYLTSPVDNETMLWEVTDNKRYFKLFNSDLSTYIKRRSAITNNNNAVFCSKNDGFDTTKYDSGSHNLYFHSNWRIVLNGTQSGFRFEKDGGSNFGGTDGRIYLFEYSTTTSEILHEFK